MSIIRGTAEGVDTLPPPWGSPHLVAANLVAVLRGLVAEIPPGDLPTQKWQAAALLYEPGRIVLVVKDGLHILWRFVVAVLAGLP